MSPWPSIRLPFRPRRDPLAALDRTRFAVLPALVNAHDHLTLNALPLPEGLPVFENAYEWFDALAPFRQSAEVARIQRIPEKLRAWHGGVKNLLAGATRVAHHDPWIRAFGDRHFPVTVLRNFDWCHSLKLAGLYGPALAKRSSSRPWFVHLAEGIDEIAKRELDVLRESRGLDRDTVIVHGTGLTASQVATSVAAGASLVWCPASNRCLFGRAVFHRQFFLAGRLALGSDSRLSGSRDLLDELRVARKESGLSPREIVQIATEGGECVCQMPPGEDRIVLRVEGGDPAEALLAATRRDLALVIRRGLPVLGDAEFEEALLGSGVPVIRFQLDGKPKVGDSRVFRREIFEMEPGLSLS